MRRVVEIVDSQEPATDETELDPYQNDVAAGEEDVAAGEPLTLQEEFDEWMRQQQDDEPPTLQEEFDEWMRQQQN